MKRVLSVLIGFLSIAVLADAQQLQSFEDEFGTKGEVRYTGGYNPGSLPKQGTVDIRWREMDGQHLKTYRVKGNTKDHAPTGAWTWEEANWQYQIKAGDGIQPVFTTAGTSMRWEGGFVLGRPEGKWVFSLDSINPAGRVVNTLIRIQITYRQGVPAGTITAENREQANPYKLIGSLDNNGIANGAWVYTYKNGEGIPVTEERRYDRGLLTQIDVTTGKNKYTIHLEHNIQFHSRELDAGTPESRRIGNVHFDREEYNTEASELFYRDFKQYFAKGWQLEPFSYTVSRKSPGFYKLEYPISAEETNDIRNARALIAKQRDSIERHLSGNIHIHRFRSVLLDTTIAYLQLNLTRLNYLDSLLNQTDDPVFTYKSRKEQGIAEWIPELNQLSATQGEVFDTVYVRYPILQPSDINIFKQVSHYLGSNSASLPPYFKTVENAGIAVRQEGELKSLEDEMVKRYDDLYLFYAEQKGIGSVIYRKFITTELPALLQEYTQTEGYADAIQMSEQIKLRLDSLDAWKDRLEIFDQMPQSLREQYAHMAYNPYNGAYDIEVITKRRFFQNVSTQMWPFMLNEMELENEWDKWVALWNRQFEMHHFLLSFVSREDAAAKRLNRRVRRDKTPERMLQHILREMKE